MAKVIYHYGVKGQKWGVIRWKKWRQARAKKKEESEKKKQIEEKKATEAKKAAVLKSRSPEELHKNAHLFTDQELNTAYNRLNTERNIKNLMPTEVSKGEKFVDGALKWTKKTSEVMNTAVSAKESYDKFSKAFGKGNSGDETTNYLNKAVDAMIDKELDKANKRAKNEKSFMKTLDDINKMKEGVKDSKEMKDLEDTMEELMEQIQKDLDKN